MGFAALASLNWIAVFVATLATFVLGAIWYGPLLGKPWIRYSGMDEEKQRESNMTVLFGGAFVLQLIAAVALALFIGPGSDLAAGAFAGFAAGAFFVSTGLGVVYLFERRPAALWAIDAGYQIAGFTLMGLILGAW